MAKVRNPFLSINASGTVGNIATARVTKYGQQIIKKPHSKRPPTELQQIERNKMKVARTAFLTLSTTDVAKWQAVATVRRRTAWMTFFQEYMVQQISAPNKPLIPAAEL